LQSGVRVGGHDHAIGLLGWAKVIDETPGTNHFQITMRQRTANLYPSSGS
jgi:hypothetical protein